MERILDFSCPCFASKCNFSCPVIVGLIYRQNQAMILRSLNYRNLTARQCSSRTLVKSATIACSSEAVKMASSIVAQHHHHDRQFSSLPHHLARQNNGLVNLLVKTTKVPRPTLPKTFNRLKKPLKQEEVTLQHVPSHLSYAGSKRMPITSVMRIVKPGEDAPSGIWPVFRMMVSVLVY